MGLLVFRGEEDKVIEGKLVNLRAQEMSDLERNWRWINDAETARLVNGRPYAMPRAAQEAWLRERAEHPLSFGRVFLAIETKAGEHIGNIDITGVSPEDRWGWLGVLIGDPAQRGRGLGSDAIRTVLRFAFDEMNLDLVRLQVWSFNGRALACYRRLGFVEEARLRSDVYAEGQWHDNVVMSITRGEFSATEAAA